MSNLQDLLNANVGSISSLILNSTSNIMGPQLHMWHIVGVPGCCSQGMKIRPDLEALIPVDIDVIAPVRWLPTIVGVPSADMAHTCDDQAKHGGV